MKIERRILFYFALSGLNRQSTLIQYNSLWPNANIGDLLERLETDLDARYDETTHVDIVKPTKQLMSESKPTSLQTTNLGPLDDTLKIVPALTTTSRALSSRQPLFSLALLVTSENGRQRLR